MNYGCIDIGQIALLYQISPACNGRHVWAEIAPVFAGARSLIAQSECC